MKFVFATALTIAMAVANAVPVENVNRALLTTTVFPQQVQVQTVPQQIVSVPVNTPQPVIAATVTLPEFFSRESSSSAAAAGGRSSSGESSGGSAGGSSEASSGAASGASSSEASSSAAESSSESSSESSATTAAAGAPAENDN